METETFRRRIHTVWQANHNLAAGKARNATAIEQRMARLMGGELSAILRADEGDMRWVLRGVREQEKASRLAGLHCISGMCHTPN